jgi:lysophospholipase L1-like esterase
MKHSKINKSHISILLLLFISIFFILVAFWLNKFIIDPNYTFLLYSVLKTILLVSTIIILYLIAFLTFRLKFKKIVPNFTLSIVSGISLLFVFEIFFSFYTPSTNDINDFSNKIWIKRNNKPINSFGYRDEEPFYKNDKKNIFVIGDSFVAGHGLKYDEMFVNTLKKSLTKSYNIFNLGVSGSHTDREFDSLTCYPIKPDLIVLCYCHNDIESAMLKQNYFPQIKDPKENLCNFSRFIIDNSLLANFIYTRQAKKSISMQFMQSEKNDIIAYQNDDLWNYQTKSLDKFYNYSIENQTDLILVFIPGLGEGIVFTNELAGKKVEQYCLERDINFINIYSAIKDLPLERRVVNSLDHHPSKEVNEIIANLLTNAIKNEE